VGFGGIVEGCLLAQIAGPPLDSTGCADDFHSVREPLPPAASGSTAYNSGKILSGRHPGTTL
jgi:hypothetical protein